MRILMTRNITGMDYQLDCLLHGLRTIDGIETTDYPRLWYMYSSEFGPGKKNLSDVYGRGFTMYGHMPDVDVCRDEDEVSYRIRNGYYDLVIMHAHDPGHLAPLVIAHVPPGRIAWIDGVDEQGIVGNAISMGRYFKRELSAPTAGVLPIGFGFPAEKMSAPMPKTRAVAHCDPRDRSTYIYQTEADYYRGYAESLFGITMCKAGWDCMRHYEIMAAGCLPWFVDIDLCPETTCTFLPRPELSLVNRLAERIGPASFMQNPLDLAWQEINEQVQSHFRARCTTRALADYFLGHML